ncbi:MAG: N-acetylmuramoyl-L-alanine amidase [Candidatus Cardinium sp.]|uniref:N-acetylmuramoyl-L-alanine amidase n=1 Tax=Cardinium endosymbiont of Dermatophagoides farinae TaxID=2597823 RepID=UPI001182DC8F|nr:N-acetylmuramoyl-L-alanine amidase [Cardinium endosymbiont of Dermatophagoides farinae]TSJ80981.1 hypothetical protein FPG78_03015 [Cardinium endosymbiont of Dermatophagoides farinae]UWW97008.1 MAG: N-acetylmuramoyl-L-alanine amidase [Candidatus Cardinium sp.]
MNINPNLRLTFTGLLLILSSCNGLRNGMYGAESSSNSINDPIVMDYSHPSPNYNERSSSIPLKIIVAHYTVGDLQSSLNTLTDPSPVGHGRVSAHYLVPKAAIDNQRKVFGLVPEDKRAWHAGVGQWGIYGDVNDVSVGIEIVNSGYKELENRRAWDPFPDYQIDTLISLMQPVIETVLSLLM